MLVAQKEKERKNSTSSQPLSEKTNKKTEKRKKKLLKKTDPEILSRLVASEGADALCLQEHKLQTEKNAQKKGGKDGAREIFGENCRGVAGRAGGSGSGGGGSGGSGSGGGNGNKLGLPGWHVTWACSTKDLGYSGVAIASRVEPLSVRIGIGNGDVSEEGGGGAAPSSSSSGKEDDDGEEAKGKESEQQKTPPHPHDVEGRFVAVEFERFWLATTYVPNSGEGLRRLKYRVGELAAAKAARRGWGW